MAARCPTNWAMKTHLLFIEFIFTDEKNESQMNETIRFSLQCRLTTLTGTIYTSSEKHIGYIFSFVTVHIFPHGGSTVGCSKRNSLPVAELVVYLPRRTNGWIGSWAFVTSRWTSNCQKKKIRHHSPLHNWRLNLNNNTYTPVALHPCEKPFVWKRG